MTTTRAPKTATSTCKPAARTTLARTDAPSTTHTLGRATFVFSLKRNSPLKITRTQLPLVHAWALTINRSMGQTLDRALLDARRPAFTHGHAYVATSRVHTADELGVFVNDACSEARADGSRVAILASVTYDELLTGRTRAAAPERDDARRGAAHAHATHAHACAGCSTLAPPSRKRRRARIEDLIASLDDASSSTARRMRTSEDP